MGNVVPTLISGPTDGTHYVNFKGYNYKKQCVQPRKIRYVCCKKDCKGSAAHPIGDLSKFAVVTEHLPMHPQDPFLIHESYMQDELRRRSREDLNTDLKEIFDSVCSQFPEVADRFSYAKAKRMMARYRNIVVASNALQAEETNEDTGATNSGEIANTSNFEDAVDDGSETAQGSPVPCEVISPCVICLEAVKRVLILPCRHLATCIPCFESIRTTVSNRALLRCPLCRGKVEGHIEAFV